jgi:hypothetical protein
MKPKKKIEDIVRRQRIIGRVIALLGFGFGMGLGLWILIEIVKIGIQK